MTTRLKLAAVASALLLTTFAASADPGELTVDDKASVFSAEGVRKAEDAFGKVNFKVPTTFTVVTYAEIPERNRAAFDRVKANPGNREKFYREWANETASRRKIKHGPFVLINMKPGHVEAVDDKQTDVERGFDDADLKTLREKFLAGFKKANDASGAEATGLRDEALLDATNFVAAQLKNTTYPTKPEGRANAVRNDAAGAVGAVGGSSLTTWLCVGGVVLLVGWLAFGVIRALTNRGGGTGGGAYGGGGGGYGGGYGGGGGGGFMPGLFGGLLGGMAGSYLYNNMFGGGGSYGGSYGGTQNDAGAAGSSFDDGGAGDYAGGGSSGGAFGDDGFTANGGDTLDDGNGDFGGGYDSGGGDFGGGDSGGGDSGGGGDF